VLHDPTIVSSLAEEAHQTALIFWRDFEKHGIHLPERERQSVVSVSSDILSLGRQFLNDANTARPPARIMPSELEGMKDSLQGARLQLQARFSKRELLVYPGSLQAQMIMRSAPAEEPRRKVYVAANSSTPEQLEVLEYLLRSRAHLAALLGQDSYATVTLSDKMAKSPGIPFFAPVAVTLTNHLSYRERVFILGYPHAAYNTTCPKGPPYSQCKKAGPS
jgi:intermediate peptidase